MSSQPLKNILLIGANGSLAPILIKHLSADPAFNLTILSREGSNSVTPANTKLVTLPTPYQAEALAPVLKRQDAVIDLIQPFDLEAHKTVIDVAIKAGEYPSQPSEKNTNKRIHTYADEKTWLIFVTLRCKTLHPSRVQRKG